MKRFSPRSFGGWVRFSRCGGFRPRASAEISHTSNHLMSGIALAWVHSAVRELTCVSRSSLLPGLATLPLAGPTPPARAQTRSGEEANLVRRGQDRDQIAFAEIVERYQTKVFSIIYSILRNRNDAEDIAQQVFAKIYF